MMFHRYYLSPSILRRALYNEIRFDMSMSVCTLNTMLLFLFQISTPFGANKTVGFIRIDLNSKINPRICSQTMCNDHYWG